MDELPPLKEAQQVALEKLTMLIDADGMSHIASQGVDVLFARLEGYMQFKVTLRLHLTRSLRLAHYM